MTERKGVVAWIGLGAMGLGMATALVRSKYDVQVYDVWAPSVEKAVAGGCTSKASPRDAVAGTSIVGLMVLNIAQVEDVLFGPQGIAAVLPKNSSVIVFSTCPPTALARAQDRLTALGTGIEIVDSPVSGGSTRAAEGTLAIMVSGKSSAIEHVRPVIDSLTQKPEGQLSVVGDSVGRASDFKLINQVYCAIQICVSGESMAFAKALGLNPRMVYDVLRTCEGNSFLFGHRIPWQWLDDGISKSAMTVIAKDVGIVMDEARLNNFPAPLCAQAEQLFTAALGAGLSREDDALIVRLYQSFGIPFVSDIRPFEEEAKQAKEVQYDQGQRPDSVLVVGTALPFVAQRLRTGGLNVNEIISAVTTESSSPTVSAVVLNVASAAEADVVLFGRNGRGGLANALTDDSTVILATSVTAVDAVRLQAGLHAVRPSIELIDAPISRPPHAKTDADLTVIASGDNAAISRAFAVLRSIAGPSGHLHIIPGGVGFASKMRAVDLLLKGIHVAAAAEATALATKKGMDLDAVFGVVSKGAASSEAMLTRVPTMMGLEEGGNSTVAELYHQLDIVLAEAKAVKCPVFIATAAHQQTVRAVASGWKDKDDSALCKLWNFMGVNLGSKI